MKSSAIQVIVVLTILLGGSKAQLPSQTKAVLVQQSVHDGGVQIHLFSKQRIKNTAKLHIWVNDGQFQGFKFKPIVNGSIDVTDVVCDQSVTAAFIEIFYGKISSETVAIDDELLIRRPTIDCDLLAYNGLVKVSFARLKRYCLNNGYVEVKGENFTKSVPLTLEQGHNFFHITVDSCRGPTTVDMEIFSAKEQTLGSCEVLVPSLTQQEIRFVKDNQQLVFTHIVMNCVQRVVAKESDGMSYDMICNLNRNNEHSCKIVPNKSCRKQIFSVSVMYKHLNNWINAGNFSVGAALLKQEFSYYDKLSHILILGRLNFNKLDCFKHVINIVYGNSTEIVEEKYTKDLNNQITVKLRQVSKQCNAMKVRASLLTVFGEKVIEKEFKLPESRLDGNITLTDYETNSRAFFNFTSSEPGLLKCFDKLKLGNSMEMIFQNPLDISKIFPKSCHEERASIHLFSSTDVTRLYDFEYVKQPSLHPPPNEAAVEANLHTEDGTIQLSTIPPGTLSCLTAQVNGSSIMVDKSGVIDVSSYSSACTSHVITLLVDTDGSDWRRVLNTSFTLPRRSVQGKLTLILDEERKTVELKSGSLACPGDRWRITALSGGAGLSITKICNFGLWIDGSSIFTEITKSHCKCRQKCQETTNCSDWRFHKTLLTCVGFPRITAYQVGFDDYISGSAACLLNGDTHTFFVERNHSELSLSPYLIPCKEAVLQVEYEGPAQGTGENNLTIVHAPHLILTHNTTHVLINVGNQDFEDCEAIKYELQCTSDSSEDFTSVLNFTQQFLLIKDYLQKRCRVRAWIEESFQQNAKFQYLDIGEESNFDFVLVMVITGFIVVVIITNLSCAIFCHFRRRNTNTKKKITNPRSPEQRTKGTDEHDEPIRPKRREDCLYETDDDYYSVVCTRDQVQTTPS